MTWNPRLAFVLVLGAIHLYAVLAMCFRPHGRRFWHYYKACWATTMTLATLAIVR